MKHLIIPALLIATTIVSCTATYKTGETPDDVYYSPNPVYAKTDDNDSDTTKRYSQENRNTTVTQPYDPYYNNRDVYYYDPRCACYISNGYGAIYAPTVVTPAVTPKAPSRYIMPSTNNNNNQYNNTNTQPGKSKGRIITLGNSSSNNTGYNNSNNNSSNSSSSSSNNNTSTSTPSKSSSSSSSGSSSSGGNAPVRSFPK